MSSGVSDGKSPATGACRTCAASQLISSFADAMDRSDLDAIGAHFAEDAVFVMPTGDQWRGRDAIVAGLAQELQGSGTHVLVNHLIEVDGNTGTSSADILFTDVVDGAPKILALAHYDDELRWDGTRWQFIRKQVSVKGRA